MINLEKEKDKTGIIGEVPLKDRPGGNVIGTAKLERTRSGALIAHVDARDIPEVVMKGFSLGSFSIYQEE